MAARSLISFCLWLFALPVHAVYMNAEPPAGWRPASGYADGYARLVMGAVGGGGALSQGGAAVYLTPNSPNVYPIIAERTPIYSDPLVDWIWRHMPGGEAHAFVPAAIYGPGVVVTTILRSGASRAALPAFLKFGANAGKDAARQGYKGAAGALFMSMVAAAGLNWVWNEALKRWEKPQDDAVSSDGYEYYAYVNDEVVGASYSDVCSKVAARLSQVQPQWTYTGVTVGTNGSTCRITRDNGPYNNGQVNDYGISRRASQSCPVGWYWTPAGCLASINNRPLTLTEFEDGLATQPWPDTLPERLPEGVPVGDPVINPLPSPWDKPQPYFWPVGDPVKNPQYDPSKPGSKENPPQLQPGRRVTGSPAPGEPWRVDVQPTDRPIDDPNEQQNPAPDPTRGPEDPASAPARPDKGDKDKAPGLCELFPNISACAELGKPGEAEKLQNQEINVSIAPDAGFGPDNAACPVERSFGSGGWTFSYAQVCTFASGVRPIVIAFAWLSAGLMVVGVARRQS